MAPDEIRGKDGSRMSEELKKQILEMCIGLAAYELVLVLLCLVFFCEPYVFLGLLVGTIAAVVFICHIGYSVEYCVESGDPDFAKRTMQAHAVQRMAAVLALAAVLARFTEINIVAVMAAILGVKPGAYLYPVVHKILIRKSEK